MSDGTSDAYKYIIAPKGALIADTDALDGRDIWGNEEITQIIKDINKVTTKKKDRDPFAWLAPVCECGSAKTYGEDCSPQMHATYCPLKVDHYR